MMRVRVYVFRCMFVFLSTHNVGNTPVMLGKKVVQRYFRGDDYLEIDIHVGSSIIATNVVGLCRGYAQVSVISCFLCLSIHIFNYRSA